MQTLSDIRRLLAEAGTQPKKRFGQNFLIDQNKLGQILDAAQLAPDDVVLEVGAGTGALTEALLDRLGPAGRLVAVEVDDDLFALLSHRLANRDAGARVQLIHADILAGKHALNPQVFAALPDAGFKLVANLPYNIASPLLVNLGLDHPAMTLAVVMVQQEVAQRMVATPGGKTFGPLSVILQAVFTLETVATLGPSCFFPPPKVASAVVKMTRRPEPKTADVHGLAAFVHQVFHRRRKQLGAILGRDFLFPARIDPNSRPERLDVDQWVTLFEAAGSTSRSAG